MFAYKRGAQYVDCDPVVDCKGSTGRLRAIKKKSDAIHSHHICHLLDVQGRKSEISSNTTSYHRTTLT